MDTEKEKEKEKRMKDKLYECFKTLQILLFFSFFFFLKVGYISRLRLQETPLNIHSLNITESLFDLSRIHTNSPRSEGSL